MFNKDPQKKPRTQLRRSAEPRDLQSLIEYLRASTQMVDDDDDEIDQDEELDAVLWPSPIISHRRERGFEFNDVATFMLEMEMLFRQSMEELNELSGFFDQKKNRCYLLQMKALSGGMRQFLPENSETRPSCELGAFIDAFKQIKATKGFSMSCYLSLHNKDLGNYLRQNEGCFEKINNAFHDYLNDCTEPRKRAFEKKP